MFLWTSNDFVVLVDLKYAVEFNITLVNFVRMVGRNFTIHEARMSLTSSLGYSG